MSKCTRIAKKGVSLGASETIDGKREDEAKKKCKEEIEEKGWRYVNHENSKNGTQSDVEIMDEKGRRVMITLKYSEMTKEGYDVIPPKKYVCKEMGNIADLVDYIKAKDLDEAVKKLKVEWHLVDASDR